MKYDFICNEIARLVTGNILDGNVCGGRSCKMYETCKARIEFDALPKHTPTDAEIDAAVANERKYGVRTDVADVLNDPKNDVLVKTVYIPARDEHEGIFGTNVKLRWVCPKCGAPRGKIKIGRSYSGSIVLFCDTWENPCGHVDKYADVRAEAAENGLNAPTTTECCICKKPTGEQLKWLRLLAGEGYAACVRYGADAAIRMIQRYMAGDAGQPAEPQKEKEGGS